MSQEFAKEIVMPINPVAITKALNNDIPALRSIQTDVDNLYTDAIRLWCNPPVSQSILIEWGSNLVTRLDRLVRIAIPIDEPFNHQYPPGSLPDHSLMIAVDGAQVHPSANPLSSYVWSTVNLGAASWNWHKNDPASSIRTAIKTDLYLGDLHLFEEGMQQSPDQIDLLRDVGERQWLADLAMKALQESESVVAWLDGKIELWGGRGDGGGLGSYKKSFEKVERAFHELSDHRIPFAGYIASAQSTLLVRLLEIAILGPGKLRQVRQLSPLRGLTDARLLEDWLKPNHRTAVFRLGTRSAGAFGGSEMALHLVYLNVGTPSASQIVRLEIPAWLAKDPVKLGEMHALLLMQCQAVDGIQYPYLIARADEAAYVSPAEIQAVEAEISSALMRAGIRANTLTAKLLMKRASRKWQK
jgi:hypothetical protein